MARVDVEDFADEDASRIFVAAALAEAQRVEAVLTANDVNYAVSVELFRAGLRTRSRHGAVFYVESARAARCRELLSAAGLGRGVINEDD